MKQRKLSISKEIKDKRAVKVLLQRRTDLTKSFFLSISRRLKHKNLLHSTVPSKAGIETRLSGPHFG